MNLHNLFRNMEDSSRLQSNQITKGLQSNLNNKISLNYKVLKDNKYSNLKSKYSKKQICNVVNLDKSNLDCLDRLNQHYNTNFVIQRKLVRNKICKID